MPNVDTFNFASGLASGFIGKQAFVLKQEEAPPVTPPVVGNFSPAVGAFIASNQFITFDVTDPEGFRLALIAASFPNLGIYEIIHDGTAFGPNYSDGNSGRSAIANGFHYSILRRGGWPASPTIVPFAIDVFGSENV